MTPVSWRRWLVCIGALALALRAIYLVELADHPLFAVFLGDGQTYDAWAQGIAGGDWFGKEVFYQAPLYPYLLAVLYALVGHSLMAVRVTQSVLGALSCVLLAHAARRFAGEKAGIAAGLLLAVYAPAIFFDGLIQKASVDLFLVTLVLALCGEFVARRRWPWLAGAGVALGVLSLNRENARVLLPVVVGWLLMGWRFAPIRERFGWAAAFVLAGALVVLPVGLRNRAIGGEFLISTSQLGPNLYIGNHAGATGSYEPLLPGRQSASVERKDATRLAEEAAGRTLTPGEVSDYWVGRAIAFVRDHPLDWLRLFGRKLLLTLNAQELSDSESLEVYAEGSRLLRGLCWLDFGMLLAAGVLGACVTRDRWPAIGLVAASAVALALSVAAFYVFDRYRYPLVPFILVFAGAGLARLTSPGALGTRQVRVGLLLSAAALAASHVALPVGYDASYGNLGTELLKLGRTSEALAYLQKGVAATPEFAGAWYDLGRARQKTGDLPGAIREFEAAIRLAPRYYAAHEALAAALQQRGDLEGAIEHHAIAAQLRPDSFEAAWNLGLALVTAGDPANARVVFLDLVRVQPNRFALRMALGRACAETGREDDALEHFTRAVALMPTSAEALHELAVTLAALGRLSEAEARLETALVMARERRDSTAVQQIEAELRACRASAATRR
jgi:Flp pilus assembly protein TadD